MDCLPQGPYSTEFSIRLSDVNDPVHWRIDEEVARGILDLLRGKSVGDIGGGIGLWTQWWRDHGVNATCFDGTPGVERITNGLVANMDLSKPLINPPVFDWVVCLEVLEHIPQEFEAVALDNLCAMCAEGLVTSWAIPGQSGFGHCNCQSNEYAVERFTARGFVHCPAEETPIRNLSGDVYHNTLMVFRKCNS